MELDQLVAQAFERRAALVERLRSQDTDCWRLFHGGSEGRPGLTIDRYGELVLVQTFRDTIPAAELASIERALREKLTSDWRLAWNHRGPSTHPGIADERDVECRERGVRFLVRARHRGLDPWLFLDLRVARAELAALAAEKSVLNLFAYTCGAGIAAAAAGAREVWNVDFAASNLFIGRRNAELNALDLERSRFIQEDCLPVLTQLAGLPVKGRASVRSYERFDARRFDLVFLDPPAWSKGPFGAVDVVRDYPSLFKPALRALEDGGTILATNHSPEVELSDWLGVLARCAEKIGRPLVALDALVPDEDFPAFDGKPPLKIARCRVA